MKILIKIVALQYHLNQLSLNYYKTLLIATTTLLMLGVLDIYILNNIALNKKITMNE